jgi:hypothetical protein
MGAGYPLDAFGRGKPRGGGSGKAVGFGAKGLAILVAATFPALYFSKQKHSNRIRTRSALAMLSLICFTHDENVIHYQICEYHRTLVCLIHALRTVFLLIPLSMFRSNHEKIGVISVNYCKKVLT